MKMTSRLTIGFLLLLSFVPVLRAQELSKYRNFSFGASVAQVTRQIGQNASDVTVIQAHPVAIQQLTWWPLVAETSRPAEPVQEILFYFYDGKLYRMQVTYDVIATAGLTAEDMTRAISAKYGTATKPVAEIEFPANPYLGKEKVIDRWEDPAYSVNLFRSSVGGAFALVMFAKETDARAATAIAESQVQRAQDTSHEEADRLKKQTDDLETKRQKNIQGFHP